MARINPLLAAVVFVGGCASTPNIKTDYDPAANFSQYRTYGWVYTQTPAGMNPLVFQRIKDSIDRGLKTRFTEAASNADFAVDFTIGRKDSVQVNDLGPVGPYGGLYRPWAWGGAGWGWSNIDVQNVTSGTLVIDFYDTKTKKPIWHGIATKDVNPNKTPTQEEIDAAVDAVLAKFPPQPGSK